MSSFYQKNNFTFTENGNNEISDQNRRNQQREGYGESIGSDLGVNNVRINPPTNFQRNSDISGYSIKERIPGPVFTRPVGAENLEPFCGTIYDKRIRGNNLDGIHIEPALAIDSKARDHTKYPNPNNYSLQLKTPYKDVTKMELKFALIPNSGYVINCANNCFYFQDRREQVYQCKYYQVELPVGDWPAENTEGPSICSILEEEMNRVSRRFGHRNDCNVPSSVPYSACSCNCSTSISPTYRDLIGSRSKDQGSNSGLKLRSKKQIDNFKDKEILIDSEKVKLDDTLSIFTNDSDTNNESLKDGNGNHDHDNCCDEYRDESSTYSVTFCRYRRKFTITQILGSGLFNIIFCGGLTRVGEAGTITHPIMGVDRFLSPEIPIREFQKKYISRSMGCILGFSPMNQKNQLKYTSDCVIDFDRDRYIILRIPGLERLQSNWDPLQGAFAIIAATKITNDFVFAKWDNDPFNSETYTKYFNPPIPNISKITIEFYNCNGEPFDFNCIDHLLIFDVGSLTQQITFPVVSVGIEEC